MFNLIRKEINDFFSSYTGYVVICTFLLLTGLFLWIIPNNSNIPDNGYADISSFFDIAPILYLFLIPAICMKMFTEERKNHTLDLLLTRPISIMKIVVSRLAAAYLLVIITLLPTLIYYYSVYHLASPAGATDNGLVWGSYTGLLFLSLIYVSVSLFACSFTSNQITAFISGMLINFLIYMGFDLIGNIPVLYDYINEITYFSINTHYEAMSRGVIDSADAVWFMSVSAIFIVLTERNILKSVK